MQILVTSHCVDIQTMATRGFAYVRYATLYQRMANGQEWQDLDARNHNHLSNVRVFRLRDLVAFSGVLTQA